MGSDLLRYAARRLLTVVAVVVTVPSVLFVLGGPYWLDEPLGHQLTALPGHLADLFLRFEWGTSGVGAGAIPMTRVLAEGLPVDLALVLGGLLAGTAGGLLLGTLSATRPHSGVDRGVSAATALAFSAPVYFLGAAVVGVFGAKIGSLPIGVVSDTGTYVAPTRDPLGWLHALWVPWLIAGLPLGAVVARITRATLGDVLGEDFLRTARAKGLRERAVVGRHAIPAALPTVLAAISVNVPLLITNVVLIEVPFDLPGALKRAKLTGDALPPFDVVQACAIELTVLVALSMALCDVLHAWLDPRVRR